MAAAGYGKRFQAHPGSVLLLKHRSAPIAVSPSGLETSMANGKTVSESNLLQTLLNLWPYMW